MPHLTRFEYEKRLRKSHLGLIYLTLKYPLYNKKTRQNQPVVLKIVLLAYSHSISVCLNGYLTLKIRSLK